MHLHGKTISLTRSTIESKMGAALKSRESFFSPEEVNITANRVSKNLPFPVLFNDIKEDPSYLPYKIIAHGIAPCGSKVTVVINGIFPSIDIEMPGDNKKENLDYIKRLLKHPNLKRRLKNKQPSVKCVEQVTGKRLIGFSPTESTFVRIKFGNLQSRRAMIDMLIDMRIPSYNNDKSSYYRVAARTYKLNLAGWNALQSYSPLNSKDYKSSIQLEIDVDDLQGIDVEALPEWCTEAGYSADVFSQDNSIAMYWDIEQFSSEFDVDHPLKPSCIPRPNVLDDQIFNIGCTFHKHTSEDSLLNVSIMLGDCQPHKDYLTVVCDSEATVILAFAELMNIMQPDFVVEFNGSQFDWPNLMGKSKLLGIQETVCKKFSLKKLSDKDVDSVAIDRYLFVEDSVKLSADRQQKIANLRLHGYIAYDLRVLLMQMNSTESKSSLKFYLEMYELEGKDDMPIPVLFTHFAKKDYVGLGEVAHYCFMDCFRLHQLANRVNLIADRRAVGLMSYTSTFDSFYRANGSKVRNLIVANAIDKGLFYDAHPIRDEADKVTGKYPGALVLKPRRGLINPMMTFEEFCKERLDVWDENVHRQGQDYISKNYDEFYK